MEKIFLWVQGQNRKLMQIFMLILASLAIAQFISRELHFYEFEKGKPWIHDDLIAPFTFSILKTNTELEEENRGLEDARDYFFGIDDTLVDFSIAQYEMEMNAAIAQLDSVTKLKIQPSLHSKGEAILKSVYKKGIIESPEALLKREDKTIFLKEGLSNSQMRFSEFFTISEAASFITQELLKVDSLESSILGPVLKLSLRPNIYLDRNLTDISLETKLALVLPYKGQVQEGETVIFKGNIVDDLKLSKLNSLKLAYEGSFWKRANFIIIFMGRALLMLGIFSLMYLFISNYYPELLLNNKNLALILVHLVLAAAITALIKELNPEWYFASPILLLPIVFMSFFDNKLATVLSLMGVLIVGFLVPNGFEFIVIQGVMVLAVSVTYQGFLRRGQFFVTIGKLLGVYVFTYLIYTLIQEGSFEEIQYEMLLLFVISCFIGLFAIPILYIYEKLFALLSDTTLLELSDTNNKLLRQLSEKAPGTFQHTLQVANLAEKGTHAIGGKTLLVRTGALYHDIGKLLNPQYFVENQTTGVNPHDELSFKESAEIIIGHVIKGIELARRSKLPDEIIDFIRTHHGTTRVEYFYRMYLKNFPSDEGAVNEFTYPGPKPFSKESAVLMMADSIEAASRSLKEKTSESIKDLIDNIISSQISLGQFDNAGLTFKDITTLKTVFLKAQLNVYHLRVEYPD
jgi:putative nucleotidyltransferase with HDIG domain